MELYHLSTLYIIFHLLSLIYILSLVSFAFSVLCHLCLCIPLLFHLPISLISILRVVLCVMSISPVSCAWDLWPVPASCCSLWWCGLGRSCGGRREQVAMMMLMRRHVGWSGRGGMARRRMRRHLGLMWCVALLTVEGCGWLWCWWLAWEAGGCSEVSGDDRIGLRICRCERHISSVLSGVSARSGEESAMMNEQQQLGEWCWRGKRRGSGRCRCARSSAGSETGDGRQGRRTRSSWGGWWARGGCEEFRRMGRYG